ncbi:hypothetical protein C455_05382 [Haloferax larsenii JCM 13917]|nr:hypothetical protein [Haloferax larsenii]ELZ80867.1 hypothetical protein C455_05382 [Haloferax larsenii JCM 13917]
MSDRWATLTDAPLSCYDCGHSYWYVGDEPHDGRCPRCGSRLVSPAGDLRIVNTQPVGAEADTTGVQLVGRDDSGRLFQYWLCTDSDERSHCTRIDICGNRVPRGDEGGYASEFFPPAVRDAAAEAGVVVPNGRHSE